MLVTPLGILIDVRPLFTNALSLIVVTPSGILTDVSSKQLPNA